MCCIHYRSEYTDGSDEENITLAAVIQSGSRALISGPWNEPLQQSKIQNQSTTCNAIPDWAANIHSPIKSFVPISQQEDSEYFSRQFSYKKDKVEKRMRKRKREGTGRKKKRKRRRVTRRRTK